MILTVPVLFWGRMEFSCFVVFSVNFFFLTGNICSDPFCCCTKKLNVFDDGYNIFFESGNTFKTILFWQLYFS